MKKLFTLLSLFTLALSASAQDLSVHPKVGVFYGPINSFEIVGHAYVKNVSGDTVLTWKRVQNALPQTWESAVCDNNTCWGTDVDTKSVNVQVGDSTIMDVHMYPYNVSGVGNTKIAVWSGMDSTNADTLEYIGNIWANSVQLVKSKELSIYPNPAKSSITLNFKSNTSADVIIYDVLGNKHKTFKHTGNATTADVSELKPGIYFIRVIEDGKTYSRTFKKL